MSIQEKFNKANVIYKITKDIDLGGETLTIPEGCTLDFQGGSFSNGTIFCKKTLISSETNVFQNVIIEGDIKNNYINIDWFDLVDNNITDILPFLFNISCDGYGAAIKLWAKEYKCGETIIVQDGVSIIGEYGIAKNWLGNKGTSIAPLSSDQQYIFKLGNGSSMASNLHLKDINFTEKPDNISCFYKKAALWLAFCVHSRFENIRFTEMGGTCLRIGGSWELDFNGLVIRAIAGIEPKLVFDKPKGIEGGNTNEVSQVRIDSISFEAIEGNLIEVETGAYIAESVIETIYGEWRPYIQKTKELSDEEYASAESLKIFCNYGICTALTFTNINLSNGVVECFEYGGKNYKMNSIIYSNGSRSSNIAIGIMNIRETNSKKQIYHIFDQCTGDNISVGNITLGTLVGINNAQNSIFNLYKCASFSLGSIVHQAINTSSNRTLEYNNKNNPVFHIKNVLAEKGGHISYINSGYNLGLAVEPNGTDDALKTAFRSSLFSSLNIILYVIPRDSSTSFIAINNVGQNYSVGEDGYIKIKVKKTDYVQIVRGYLIRIEECFSVENETFSDIPEFENKIYVENANLLFSGKNLNLNHAPYRLIFDSVNALLSGPSDRRPGWRRTGYWYFDTTLNKPVMWTGSKWVDATGAEV